MVKLAPQEILARWVQLGVLVQRDIKVQLEALVQAVKKVQLV